MVGRVSAQIALLAFAIAIAAGLYAGNAPVVVLRRALVAMLVGLVVGKLVGWTTRLAVRDHLRRGKLAHDNGRGASTLQQPEGIKNQSQTVKTG